MKTKLYARGVVIADGGMLLNSTQQGAQLFGALVKPGEHSYNALKRAFLDDLGVVIDISRLAGISERVEKLKGRKVRIIEVLLEVASMTKVRDGSEGDDYQPMWVPMAKLPALRTASLAVKLAIETTMRQHQAQQGLHPAPAHVN